MARYRDSAMKPRKTAVVMAVLPSGRLHVVGFVAVEHQPAHEHAQRRQHEPHEDPQVDEGHAEQMAIDGRDPGKQADHRDVRDAYADEQLEHGLSPFAPMKELAVVAAL